jgi:hypothetical protein
VARGGYPDAGGFISAQLIAQAAKGNVQDSCGVSPIAAAGSERENDVLSYRLSERRVIFGDHHDFASSWRCMPQSLTESLALRIRILA